jgi:superfamily II DNA helicase RecQ
MIAQYPRPHRVLRNWAIASIIALTATLAPIVRADTVRFLHTVFAGSNPSALVRADITK